MDVRGELVDPVFVRRAGESFDRTFSVIWTALFRVVGNDSAEQRRFIELFQTLLESLILAQDERWRRA